MFDFSPYVDLPLIWGILIATAIFLYVVLDGFDLGCGILFPFAPSHRCRDRMMNSIAPFWDGNETWLVLGGGGLFAAFPVAYGIIMPAVYLPIIFMLLGLIFRGVAFEFRFKASANSKYIWDAIFHGGSLLAAFMQGIILGNFIQGIHVEGRSFAGYPLEWADGFNMLCGLGVVFAYALIGCTWLIMKTEGQTQKWARIAGKYVLAFVGVFLFMVSIAGPIAEPMVYARWFTYPNYLYLSPIPILTAAAYLSLWLLIGNKKYEVWPFLLTIGIFFLCYVGFGISMYPWIVPYKFTIWQAASIGPSLSLMLVGTVLFLPVILGYTAYCYYVFRGKTCYKPLY